MPLQVQFARSAAVEDVAEDAEVSEAVAVADEAAAVLVAEGAVVLNPFRMAARRSNNLNY